MTCICYNSLVICVAVSELEELDREVSATVGQAWAVNTLKTRNSQWSKYLTFCIDMGLKALPADPSTVSRFLVFLARSCKFSTINNYLSAINVLHKFYGHGIDYRQYYLIQLILKGLKRQLGTQLDQSRPFSKNQLIAMYATLDLTNDMDIILWSALIFSFRTLLRKSNVLPDTQVCSDHIIRRKDIDFTEWGMMVHVHSSKTIQHKQYVLDIPITYVKDQRFCAVTTLEDHLRIFPKCSDAPLFFNPKTGKPVLYRELLTFIKRLAKDIGINDKVGCHSLRRSGAAFLHSIGTPLEDIMSIGDWRSMAVLSYLATPMDRKRQIQDSVASDLS